MTEHEPKPCRICDSKTHGVEFHSPPFKVTKPETQAERLRREAHATCPA